MASIFRRGDFLSHDTPSKGGIEQTPPTSPDEPVNLKQHFQKYQLENGRNDIVDAPKHQPNATTEQSSSSYMTSIFGVIDCSGGNDDTATTTQRNTTRLYNEWGVPPGDDSSADGSNAYPEATVAVLTPEEVQRMAATSPTLSSGRNTPKESQEHFEMVLHDNNDTQSIKRTWSFGKKKKEEALLGIGKRQELDSDEWMPSSPYFNGDGDYQAQLLATVSKDETEATGATTNTKKKKIAALSKLPRIRRKPKDKSDHASATPSEPHDPQLKQAIGQETFGDRKASGFALFRGRSNKSSKNEITVFNNDAQTETQVEYDPVLQYVVENEPHGDKADKYHKSMLKLAAKQKKKNGIYDPELKKVCETEIQGSAAERFPGRFFLARQRKAATSPTTADSLQVTVPGTDKVLSDDDLLGNEFVEEDIMDEDEEDDEVALNQVEPEPVTNSQAGFYSMGLSATIMSVFRGRKEGESLENEPDYIRKAYTWIEENECADPADMEAPYQLERQKSAPMAMLTKSFSFDRKKKKAPKPMWRAAIDPQTGREYYYHRETRETTWKKPEGVTILPPKEIPQVINLDEEKDGEKEEQHDDDSVESEGPLRKKTLRDFDPEVWRKKTDIYGLLLSMSPPDGTSVKKLMRQYEGRENDLLEQLRDLKAEQQGDGKKPFDEPMEEHSMRTGIQSVRTAQIRNTRAPMIHEEDASSFSSTDQRHAVVARRHIRDIPRTRELVVEDLATDRIAATYDRRRENIDTVELDTRRPALNRAARIRAQAEAARMKNRVQPVAVVNTDKFEQPPKPDSPERKIVENSPVSDSPGRLSTVSSSPDRSSHDSKNRDDSISGLSEHDMDFVRQNRLDKARRRALDDAIAKEDWARAAQLSEALRSNRKADGTGKLSVVPKEWKQTSLDRFISENDWDAVSEYIADMRKRDQLPPRPMGRRPDVGDKTPHTASRSRTIPPSTDSDSVSKRFGATSQLQQPSNDAPSVSSWESGSSDADYSTGDSYSSDDQLRYAVRSEKRHPRHFAT